MTGIAGYKLFAIETGRFALDGGAMFGIVPRPLWERKIEPDNQNRIPLAMRCLLLIGNDRVILVDNGLGNKYDDKFASIFSIDHQHSELHRSLDQVGVKASEVTDVILTHLHFDHCGGSTEVRDGSLVTTFPNAVYHVQKAQWDWAETPNPRERNSFLKENLAPLKASGQLRLLDGPGEFLTGIESLVVNGHTRGMQIIKVADEKSVLVFVADLLPTAAHLPKAWVMAYDLWPMKTMDEKELFLDEASARGWVLFFEHDAITETARVQKTERGWIAVDKKPLSDIIW